MQLTNFRFFFDRQTVRSALSNYERRVLTGSGAFGRAVMRNSIKRAPRKKRYRAQPPYPKYHGAAREGLRVVLFGYDRARHSVAIGSLLFRGTRRTSTRRTKRATITTTDMSGKTVPQKVNEGGVSRQVVEYKSGHTYTKIVNHRAFPYADLAFRPTVDKMREISAKTELR